MLYTENIVYLNSPKQMRQDAFNLAKYVQCNHKVQICTHAMDSTKPSWNSWYCAFQQEV